MKNMKDFLGDVSKEQMGKYLRIIATSLDRPSEYPSTHAIARELITLAKMDFNSYDFPSPNGKIVVTDMKDYPSDDFIYIDMPETYEETLLIVHVTGNTDTDLHSHDFVDLETHREYLERQMLNEIWVLKQLAKAKFPETIEDVEEAEREYQAAIDRGEFTPSTDEELMKQFDESFKKKMGW